MEQTTVSTKCGTASARRRWRRLTLSFAFVGVTLGTFVATPLGTFMFRTAGWALVVNEALTTADAIVVAVDADRAGVLEAADLVSRGVAARVAVFVDPPLPADGELIRRGVPLESDFARMARELRALGVRNVEQMPEAVTGSEDQGRVLPQWTARHGLTSIIVVTSADHSRRLRRILNRAMKDGGTRLTVRASRYSGFDPDSWWQSRTGLRTGLEELQKLSLDIIRHPLP